MFWSPAVTTLIVTSAAAGDAASAASAAVAMKRRRSIIVLLPYLGCSDSGMADGGIDVQCFGRNGDPDRFADGALARVVDHELLAPDSDRVAEYAAGVGTLRDAP